MAEDGPSQWSGSDKLAVVLACAGAALGLILFLVEKTPLTVGLIVAAIAVLLVYPILHFVRSGVARLLVIEGMVLLVCLFGWSVWPKSRPEMPVASTAPPLPAPSSIPVQPPTEEQPALSHSPPGTGEKATPPPVQHRHHHQPPAAVPKPAEQPVAPQIINAPNGIGAIGSTLVNPQVTNIGVQQPNHFYIGLTDYGQARGDPTDSVKGTVMLHGFKAMPGYEGKEMEWNKLTIICPPVSSAVAKPGYPMLATGEIGIAGEVWETATYLACQVISK